MQSVKHIKISQSFVIVLQFNYNVASKDISNNNKTKNVTGTLSSTATTTIIIKAATLQSTSNFPTSTDATLEVVIYQINKWEKNQHTQTSHTLITLPIKTECEKNN